jgi:multisubunit Na+/H+ antiporter MnhG subunit
MKVQIVIAAVTLFAVVYQVMAFTDVGAGAALILFLLSPFAVCYMAYVVLKHGKPSDSTFDEKFYEDRDAKRKVPRRTTPR